MNGPDPERDPVNSPRESPRACILTVNGGSSSLKVAVFAAGPPPVRVLTLRVERIGRPGPRLVVRDASGAAREDGPVDAPDQGAAARMVIDRLREGPGLDAIAAVGHRVVHGGERFVEPQVVTPAMLDGLRRIAPLDPNHLPGEIALIEAFAGALPHAAHVALFDTAFHRTLARPAQIVPIPRRFWSLGVRRYGFHGLSYAYLMEELGRESPEEAGGRVILAHLGAGASLAAVRGGRCVDTTMGFTPSSGLVMATRCGDIDPSLVAFLAHAEGMTPDQFQRMASEESGLLGVSETGADLRDLLALQHSDERAAEAVELFCYRARSSIGSMAAAIGGLDVLVFAGGVGENSPEVRRRICAGLEFLGVALDGDANGSGLRVISTPAAAARVRVIPTDEEAMIARETVRLALAPS